MAKRGMYRATYAVLVDDLDFQQLPERARHLFHVMKISRVGNMAGIFICDRGEKLTLAKQTGIPVLAVNRALGELERGRWILSESSIVWLRNALRYDPKLTLNNENHQKAIQKVLRGLPALSIVAKFCNYYKLAIPSHIPSRYHRDTIEIPLPITDILNTDILNTDNTETDILKTETDNTDTDTESTGTEKISPLERFNKWVRENHNQIMEMAVQVRQETEYTQATDTWVRQQIARMRTWIMGHPERQMKRPGAFISNWFTNPINKETKENWRPDGGYMTSAEEQTYYANKRRQGETSDFATLGSIMAQTEEVQDGGD